MRRAEREVFDADIVRAFLENNNIVRIAFNTGGAPYIVPIGYGFDYDGKELTLYMHGAKVGRKMELAAGQPNVGFEVDHAGEVVKGETPSDSSISYQSIIGTGHLQIIEDVTEKEKCFNKIMYQFTGNNRHEYSQKALEMTAALKLVADSFTMKQAKY